jgi:hypothetical protein
MAPQEFTVSYGYEKRIRVYPDSAGTRKILLRISSAVILVLP